MRLQFKQALAASLLAGTAFMAPAYGTLLGPSACDRGCDTLSAAEIAKMSPSELACAQPQPNFSDNAGTGSPSLTDQSSTAGNSTAGSSGGGFSGLDFISGSTSGSSFAAMAPGSYIDNAVVTNMFRVRFDAAYNNPLPDRVEFFYAQCGILGGRGPAIAETNVDYQELTPYFEKALTRRFSLFLETPVRFINPELNDNATGFGDLQAGFKRAIYAQDNQYLTAQLRVFTPTGNPARGLGTGHASLEPALLYLGQRSDRLILQSEFRVWVPLSDSTQGNESFAGPVLRYGIGGGYDLLNMDTRCKRRRLQGTLEAVGWTITNGFATDGSLANPAAIDVSGDTIVNIKTGLRYISGRNSLAAAYGVPVTGDQWYSDIFRIEYRYAY
jgi:hypothetical protein